MAEIHPKWRVFIERVAEGGTVGIIGLLREDFTPIAPEREKK
jgi:hypothetical protein